MYSQQNKDLQKYFSISYLIKFGYFDFKYKKDKRYDGYLLSNLVYKKVFNTDMLEKNFIDIEKSILFNSKKDTTPIEISFYKNDNERRPYKLLNMYSYICLCKHLHKNKDKYIEIINSSDKSLSKMFYSDTFLSGKIIRSENRFGKKNIFKTDIQNFFPSIYTHSIPWILVGKSEAKKNKDKPNLYYNQLDRLIQRSQRGETHGIPTGSFATRLIAEIYTCKLDEGLKKFEYLRYVDDFELPYNDEKEKIDFYNCLNKELSRLNLKLKIEKNQIISFPFVESTGSDMFFDYFSNIKDIESKTSNKQGKHIHNFIEFSTQKESQGNKGSLKLMFKALKDSIGKRYLSIKSFSKPIMKKLFNLVLMTPELSVYYLEFIDSINSKEFEKTVVDSIIEIEIQSQYNIKRYIEFENHQEMYSLLSLFYYLRIHNICNKTELIKIIETMDDLSSILAFEMYLKSSGFRWVKIFKTLEKKMANSNSWEDEFWLFKYHFFSRIEEDKNSKLKKEYKKYMYNNYNNGLQKSEFFDKKNFKKAVSPINLLNQHSNSNSDISNFYKKLIEEKISFLNKR